jgi:hypothetical protein
MLSIEPLLSDLSEYHRLSFFAREMEREVPFLDT